MSLHPDIAAVIHGDSEGCIIRGDSLSIMADMPDGCVDAVVTDPSYPNNAGHFIQGIETARRFCKRFACSHWLVFWDDVTQPPVPHPLVARHSWHRTNTNRPDNCEAIYEFCSDGTHKNSRVYPYCVIYPGMTGIQATGHPTEKHVGLMTELVGRTRGIILDPFCGSGTTCVAAKKLGRRWIGIDIEERYCEIGRNRIRDTPRPLFTEPAQQQAAPSLFEDDPNQI